MYVQEGSLLWFLNSISLREIAYFIAIIVLTRTVISIISLGKDGRAMLWDMTFPLIFLITFYGPLLYFLGWEFFHFNAKGVYFLVEHGIVSIETYEPFANSAEAVFRFIIMDVILRIIGFVLLLALGLFGLYIAAYVILVLFFIIRDILRKFGIIKSKENTTAVPDQLSDAAPPLLKYHLSSSMMIKSGQEPIKRPKNNFSLLFVIEASRQCDILVEQVHYDNIDAA